MSDPNRLRAEVASRRTFAIISHPDAGKTTMTERLLLHGGAIHLAGSVKGRRATTSDWMEIERQRGISISTSVLSFEYRGRRINLLDTPGHNDFSEDTYRTLAAADAAVMLIDSVKGVEAQTVKLYQVCRLRQIPIVTFINKMDREGREPIDLLDEIERVLGIPCSPVNWPVGAGKAFVGVYDRWDEKVLRFTRAEREGGAAEIEETTLDDPEVRERLGPGRYPQLVEALSLLDAAGNEFDAAKFLAGQVTPVFFGSAIADFGVEPFLDRFVELAPPPRPRATSGGPLAPDAPDFSAFVFKIQANMDPRHRDRIAFLRVCSGRFEPGMEVLHVRTGKPLPLTRPLHFMAQERVLAREGYSGDIVGLWDGGVLRIGDSLCLGPPVEFEGIPRFSPEHFARVRLVDTMKRKQLKKGLDQLGEEGVVQCFFDRGRLERDPILGAVGALQFEVVQHRLKTEYGAHVELDRLPYAHARWVEGDEFKPEKFERPGRSTCVLDVENRPLVLFDGDWTLRMAVQDNPQLKFIAAVQPGRRAKTAA